jgi:taurine transport system permease protein
MIRNYQTSTRARSWALRLVALALAVGLWQLIAAAAVWPEAIVPRPTSVWERFVQSITVHDGVKGLSNAYLWEHLWASTWRLVQGVAWAVLIGVPLGLVLALVRPVRLVLGPFVDFVRSLPPLAYFSLLIIWFGIEDSSKIWLLFLAAIAPIALAVVSGVDAIRPSWTESAQALGASPTQTVVRTVVPAVLPDFFTGLRLAVGFAFTTIVAAETVNGLPGIGGLAWETKKFQQTDIAVLCVIVIGLTAVLIDQLIRAAERRLVPWKGRV